jgi:hypothetical protein
VRASSTMPLYPEPFPHTHLVQQGAGLQQRVQLSVVHQVVWGAERQEVEGAPHKVRVPGGSPEEVLRLLQPGKGGAGGGGGG